MDELMQTHFDPVEARLICHPQCAIMEIQRLRDLVSVLEHTLELDLRHSQLLADRIDKLAIELDKLRRNKNV